MTDLEARARALNERVVSEATPVEVVVARARRYRSRRRFAAAGIAACVVVAGVMIVAFVGIGAGRGVRTVNSTPSDPRSISPKVRAERLGGELLDDAVLPPGAERYAGTPPAALAGPFEAQVTPNLVDQHRLWIVNLPSGDVVTFLQHHTPLGMVVGACCGSANYGEGGTVNMVQSTEPASGLQSSEIESAQLQMSVARRTATTAWVRADAQVVWRARRDPAERVTRVDRVIVVTREPAVTPDPSSAPLRIVITDSADVDRLERVFNELPTVVPGSRGCPLDASTYVVGFGVTVGAKPDVVARLFCGQATVTVHGRPAATLDAGPLIADVSVQFGK